MRYVDLCIAMGGSEKQSHWKRLSRFSDRLRSLLVATHTGSFTGEEIRTDEFIVSFKSETVSAALREVQKLLDIEGLLSDASVRVHDSMVPSQASASISLKDIDEAIRSVCERSNKSGRRRRKPQLYDYYAIPLPDGRYGYTHYIFRDPVYGDIVQILSPITDQLLKDTESLREANELFPPVLTSVSAGIRVGGWIWLGNRPAEKAMKFPAFRGTNSLLLRRHEPGSYDDWWLWSGSDKWEFVGSLDEAQKQLEYNICWPPADLAERIATGKNEYDRFC